MSAKGNQTRELLPIEDLFWRHVPERGDGCWIFVGARRGGSRRYGAFGVRRKMDGAHRVSWQLAYGPIPEGLHVLHHCDNPPCVRPDHLFLGTNADNMADMVAKGRHAHGEHGTRARLTPHAIAQARERRAAGETIADLAVELGVSRSTLSHAVNGRNWRHLVESETEQVALW